MKSNKYIIHLLHKSFQENSSQISLPLIGHNEPALLNVH